MINVLQHAHSPCVEPLHRAVQAVQTHIDAAVQQRTVLQMLENDCAVLYATTLQVCCFCFCCCIHLLYMPVLLWSIRTYNVI